MSSSEALKNSRRKALQGLVGAGALPLMGRLFNEDGTFLPSALAQGVNSSVGPGQGGVTHETGASTQVVQFAEWEQAQQGSEATDARNRIAQGPAVAKAPATASRYEAKAFAFPTGTVRVLTWKKGTPVLHQVTFETEIFVLQGTIEVGPLFGHKGKKVTLRTGDAMTMPAGVIRNAKTTEDTILFQAFVGAFKTNPKSQVLYGKDVKAIDGAAQPGSPKFKVKRYVFDGFSIRHITMPKGVVSDPTEKAAHERFVYVHSGHMRRLEGGQTYDVHGGDAFREKPEVPGGWEVLEPSVFLIVDAPSNPATYAPSQVAPKGPGKHLHAMLIDDNNRSYSGFVTIALKAASETESFSEKQAGLYWRLGPRPQIVNTARSSRNYVSDAGPYEMHVGGEPHFVGLMAGHLESTHQDGSVWRFAPGDFNFVLPGALHHSSYFSNVPGVMFNLFLPGTAADTEVPKFK